MPKRKLTPEQRERDRARKRVNRPYLKPGPKPRRDGPVEGRDYFCGGCAGRYVVPCEYCMDGCSSCGWRGETRCQVCEGGRSPVPPPDTLGRR